MIDTAGWSCDKMLTLTVRLLSTLYQQFSFHFVAEENSFQMVESALTFQWIDNDRSAKKIDFTFQAYEQRKRCFRTQRTMWTGDYLGQGWWLQPYSRRVREKGYNTISTTVG
jgi:hypothetical protein